MEQISLLGKFSQKPSFQSLGMTFLLHMLLRREWRTLNETSPSSFQASGGCCHTQQLSHFSGLSTVSWPLPWWYVLSRCLDVHCFSLYCPLASCSMFCYSHMANLVLRGPIRRSPSELSRFLAWEECVPCFKSIWCTEHFAILMDHSHTSASMKPIITIGFLVFLLMKAVWSWW